MERHNSVVNQHWGLETLRFHFVLVSQVLLLLLVVSPTDRLQIFWIGRLLLGEWNHGEDGQIALWVQFAVVLIHERF